MEERERERLLERQVYFKTIRKETIGSRVILLILFHFSEKEWKDILRSYVP